jgi:hypothetical protein
MTHQAIVTADDLTQTTANTAQTIKLCDLVAGDINVKVALRVKTPFENTADAAFNTTTVSVGDVAAVNTYLTAAETNKNGTVVPTRVSTNTAVVYTAADKVAVTFNAMAAKSLSSINKGELHVFFRLYRIPALEQAASGGNIVTK